MNTQLNFPGGDFAASLDAVVHDNTDPFKPENIILHYDGTSFNHAAVDFEFRLSHTTLPALAGILAGPYDITIYWEGMGTAPEGQMSQEVTGSYDAAAKEMVLQDRMILNQLHAEGVYRISLVIKIDQPVPSGGHISQIAGFVDLGMIQIVNA